MRTTPRTRTLSVLLAVLLAAFTLTSVSAVTTAPPAAASYVDVPVVPGTPGSAPGGPPTGTFQCSGSKLVSGSRIVYNWTGICKDGNYTPRLLGDSYRMCNTGMAVFRFYGTVANPIAGWTASRATPQEPNCTGDHNDWYRLYRNVPSDAARPGEDLPPAQKSFGTSFVNGADGLREVRTDAGFLGGINIVAKASGTVPGDAARNTGYWATWRGSTQRFSGGCSTIQSTNYWADYYQQVLTSTDPVYTPEVRESRLRSIRLSVYTIAERQAEKLKAEDVRLGRAGDPAERHTLAMQTIGVQTAFLPANPGWGRPAAVPGHDLQPVIRDGKLVDVIGVVYPNANPAAAQRLPSYTAAAGDDRFTEVFSTNPCYSDANFYNQLTPEQITAATSVTNPAPLTGAARDNFEVRGICYIPLFNAARMDTGGYPGLAAASSYFRLGERFGNNFVNTTGTAGREDLTAPGAATLAAYAGADTPKDVFKTYRIAMALWYGSQAAQNAGTSDWGSAGSQALFAGNPETGGVQTLPAQPYDYSRQMFNTDPALGQTLNPADAQRALYNLSRCELQPITVAPSHPQSDGTASEPTFDFATNLVVDAPGFMRAGGNMWTKNAVSARAATGPGLINGVSCQVATTGGKLRAGEACPPGTYGDSVTIKPATPAGAAAAPATIFDTSASTYNSKNMWPKPCGTGFSCIDQRFAHASVGTGDTFTATVDPAKVATTVNYSYDAVIAPEFTVYDPNSNEVLYTSPAQVERRTKKATYTGLTTNPARPGSVTVPNPNAPDTPFGSGGISLTYQVWGSVNGGGGITGGTPGDGTSVLPGGMAGPD